MLAHRLLGGGSSSLSVPCPSLGSVLIAAARTGSGAPLSGALNPLSSRTRKQRGKKKSLVSSAALDFSPRLPPSQPWHTSPLQAVFTPPTPVVSLGSDRSPSLSSQPPPAPEGEQRSLSGW